MIGERIRRKFGQVHADAIADANKTTKEGAGDLRAMHTEGYGVS